jgi:hypothetical protein
LALCPVGHLLDAVRVLERRHKSARRQTPRVVGAIDLKLCQPRRLIEVQTSSGLFINFEKPERQGNLELIGLLKVVLPSKALRSLHRESGGLDSGQRLSGHDLDSKLLRLARRHVMTRLVVSFGNRNVQDGDGQENDNISHLLSPI